MGDLWAERNREHHDRTVADYDRTVRPAWLPDAVFDFRRTARKWIETVPRGSPVLDVGAGTGDTCRELSELGFQEIHAIDISPSMVAAAAQAAPNIHAQTADVADLPYADATFGLINVKGCLHHVRDFERALDEIARCLRPGGVLRLQEPNADSALIDRTASAIERPLSLRDITNCLERRGLHILEKRTFLHFSAAAHLSRLGLGSRTSSFAIRTLNPLAQILGQGEIFLIIARKLGLVDERRE